MKILLINFLGAAHRLARFALLLLLSSLSQAAIEPIDRVIAIVDDDVVLASELEERVHQVMTNFNQSGRAVPPLETVRSEVLDRLILENIQLQMAYRAGVRISDAQLNDAMSRIAKQNGFDLGQFKAALEADGMSYTATREQVRNEMMIGRVQQGNVNQRVQITEQEINNFLASEEGQSLTSPEYHVMHTLIPVSSSASDSETAAARAYAEKLFNRIQGGESYAAVTAGKHPYPLNTTDLGWRKLEDMPSLLTGHIQNLGNGQTAAPFQSPSGFHLMELADSRGVSQIIQQTHARHILLKASAIRDNDATRQQLNDLRQRILNGEDFGELAREYSEDIGSALEGGDLGWASPGQFVSAFQKSMDNTAINDVSPVFKSRYGWHILQVLERREKDVSDTVRQNIARNFIHKRKFDDELQTWLQKIRDEAYVDLK